MNYNIYHVFRVKKLHILQSSFLRMGVDYQIDLHRIKYYYKEKGGGTIIWEWLSVT